MDEHVLPPPTDPGPFPGHSPEDVFHLKLLAIFFYIYGGICTIGCCIGSLYVAIGMVASFAPEEFNVVSMRSWDNFFWWVETDRHPADSVVAPVLFEDRAAGIRPLTVSGTIVPESNRVRLVTRSGKATVYLSPDIIDFNARITISVNRQRDIRENIRPQIETILEDARTRGDRQHPFWAKIEVNTGRR